MKNLKFIICTLTIAVSTVTFAQDQNNRKRKPDPATMIKTFDTDKDGKLSKAEVEASERKRLIENFKKIDTDEDGFLKEEELVEMLKRHENRQGR